MTAKNVLEHGPCVRREHGAVEKIVYVNAETLRRFDELRWTLEARRLNLRTANRRWRRRNGRSLRGA